MKHRIALSDAECEAEFQRVSKDLLGHNPTQGVNYWAGSAQPTMLIWAGRVYDFLRVLEEVVGYLPARRYSYLVGHRSGWDGAEVNSQFYRDSSPEDARVALLLAGARIMAGAGWGRCEIEYDTDTKAVRWEFPAGTAVGLAARMDGTRKNPACPFMAGFVAGWTNRALGLQVEVLEAECVARGHPRCVFESTDFIRFREKAAAGGPSEALLPARGGARES